MKALFQFAKNAVAQATLPDRWERACQMPDSDARREILRKLLAELEPRLDQEGELALNIATELLAGKTEFADWEAVERVADRSPGNHRALDQALARAAGKSSDKRALLLLTRLGEAHPNDSGIQMLLGRTLLGNCEDDALPALARSVPFLPAPDRAALEKFLEPRLAVGLDSSDAEYLFGLPAPSVLLDNHEYFGVTLQVNSELLTDLMGDDGILTEPVAVAGELRCKLNGAEISSETFTIQIAEDVRQ